MGDDPAVRPPPAKRLPAWRKIAYGSGDSGFALTSTVLALFYLDFLINIVGLNAALAGIAIGLGRIWDALNDLLIGTLSDRTRSRWGRRRPYMLFGAVPFGIAFVLMWLVPPARDQVFLAVYYAAMYVVFDTLFTLVNVPYAALTPDLATDYDERTSLHSYRMAFSIGLGLVGAVLPLALVDALSGPNATLEARRGAYATMGVLLGVASIVPIYITLAATRERPEYQRLPAPSIGESFRMAVGNRAFLIAAVLYLLTWIPIDLIQFVLVFLMRDYFGLDGPQRNAIFVLLFGVAVLALPLWVWTASRWDKVRAYQAGMAFLAIVLIALSVALPGQFGWLAVLAALAGIGLSAAHAIPLAMLPDTVEWDELRSARRQEAAYYSVITLIQKVVGAATIALTGVLLTASGYVEQGESAARAAQPEAAINTIRTLSGPLPAVFFVAGIVVVMFYPLTRERHARIVRALEKKRELRKRFADAERQTAGAD